MHVQAFAPSGLTSAATRLRQAGGYLRQVGVFVRRKQFVVD
jgi:hypothetical protein